MWREQLGGSRNVLRRDLLVLLQASKDIIFLFRDVELVEPADNLNILADLFRHHFPQAGQDRGGREQVFRHQEFGEIEDLLEHVRHGFMPVITC